MRRKSPFGEYSLEEIAYAEATSYTIQIGTEFFNHKGRILFSKKSAKIHYNRLVRNMADLIKDGSEEEKQMAKKYVASIHIKPLRLN